MTSPEQSWDVKLRPRLMPLFAYGVAFLIVAAHIAGGFVLKIGSSGVVFRTADQVALGLLGVVLAGVALLFTRPRLRVGPAGLSVRNLLGDKLVPWTDVVDVSFPAGARWARVELAHDEYIPTIAIQAVDKVRAVQAMETVRELMRQYRPDASAPTSV